MTRAAEPSTNPSASNAAGRWLSGYFKRSELPLHALVFLLPAMVLFEIGISFHPDDPIAFHVLQQFFERLGATGRFIPLLSVVAILLTWHIARKDPWKVDMETLWGMFLESILLAMPLLALGIAVARWHIHVPLGAQFRISSDNVILSLGAGVYEEFVFRLGLMTMVCMIAVDVLRLRKSLSNLLMVLASAVLFSLYHYLGTETFQLQSFVFRASAGIYFAMLFLTRGFGVTCGCHIAYDIAIVLLRSFAPH
jgi:membrane protease YdiL (CAAX protease family)